MIRVEYMNVGGSGDRCHKFLEWCRDEGVGVVFAGEAAAYRGGGTTTMAGYNIVSKWGKGQRVVAYVTGEWEDKVEVAYQGERMVVLKLGVKVIAGVYGDSKAGRKKYRKWLKEVRKRIGRKEVVVMGDWNAYHKVWADRGDTLVQDGRGEELRNWQCAGQWNLACPEGPTWEREVEGRWKRTTIDLAFYRGVGWEQTTGVKLSADYWTVRGRMGVEDINGIRKIREGIDWPRLEALMTDPGGDWYHEVVENDAYEKLRDLRERHLKEIVICPRSKRWWDGELTAQAKVVRRARRGGKRRRLVGGWGRREADSWKVEATKMKAMIRRKKEACWRKFCEESGDKNPWEVVRWARDPFRLGERMSVLRDAAGTQLASNQEKVDGFVYDIFGGEEGGAQPNWEKEYPEWPLSAGTLEGMVMNAIRGTL